MSAKPVLWVVIGLTVLFDSVHGCSKVLIITDPQEEHTSNKGITRHPYNDIILHALIEKIRSHVESGCHVFLSAQFLTPDSCWMTTPRQLADQIVIDWFYGPQPIKLKHSKTRSRLAGATEVTAPTEPRTSFSHESGGPQSTIQKTPGMDNPESQDDLANESNKGSAGGTMDLRDLCWSLPPAARTRCGLARSSTNMCTSTTKISPGLFPPILIAGLGTSYPVQLVRALDEIVAQHRELVHIIVRGLDPNIPITRWSLLDETGAVVVSWLNARTSLDGFLSNINAVIPERNQKEPVADPDILEWMKKNRESYNKFGMQPSLRSFLTSPTEDGSDPVSEVEIAGYMLETTILETISDLRELFVNSKTGNVPRIVLDAWGSVAMFPQKYTHIPDSRYLWLPRKPSMDSIVLDLAMQQVVVDTIGTASLSSVLLNN